MFMVQRPVLIEDIAQYLLQPLALSALVMSTCSAILLTQPYDVQEEIQAGTAAAEALAVTKEHKEDMLLYSAQNNDVMIIDR